MEIMEQEKPEEKEALKLVPQEPPPSVLPSTSLVIQSLIENIKQGKIPAAEIEICPGCLGTGMEYAKGEKSGSRPCSQCRMKKLRALAVAKIPERNRRFGVPELATLTARLPEEHKKNTAENQEKIIAWQNKVIRYANDNPFQSINLCGTNKIGKSQIAYALYLNAFENYRETICFNMKDLLIDYARSARGEQDGLNSGLAFTPRLTKEMLNRGKEKWTVLIDEFHVPLMGLTDPQFATTFEILDAIKASRHQLILLSNYPMPAIRRSFAKKDPLLSDSVISRIQEEAVTSELFLPETEEPKEI